ncbi:MAG: iron-containing alcohol dehydrogenase [Lachnospiraceae bacterium]|nr:iron-containing alcohol dehydrogenase [Lachnospiraceae bacterium]
MDMFEFSIPQNVIFGAGSISKLPAVLKSKGYGKVFIISGPHLEKSGLVKKCLDILATENINGDAFTETEGNPCTDTVCKALEAYKECKADCIIAFGGGSPIDVAKAVALLAAYGGDIKDYEGVGTVKGATVPLIAIPTTAGTGSEVTAFSVITDHKRKYKLTVGSPYLIPSYAILDPDLIASVPVGTAAACGIDAMVHAMEAYVSKASSSFSDMFALKALELIGSNIRTYVDNRSEKEAAEAMMLGSLYAGIAFSHARLGNVHAMSHPVSAFFNVPHGVANAILLRSVVEFNKSADTGKYYEIWKRIAEDPVDKGSFTPDMLSEEIKRLNEDLGIPSGLKDVGVSEDKIEAMAKDAMKSGNIKVNPRYTTFDDVVKLYRIAM